MKNNIVYDINRESAKIGITVTVKGVRRFAIKVKATQILVSLINWIGVAEITIND